MEAKDIKRVSKKRNFQNSWIETKIVNRKNQKENVYSSYKKLEKKKPRRQQLKES